MAQRKIQLSQIVPFSGTGGSVGPLNVPSTRSALSSDANATLVFSAVTYTIVSGLPIGWGFMAICPSSGSVSIACGAGVTINGASSTVTRAIGSNVYFTCFQTGTDQYVVTGV